MHVLLWNRLDNAFWIGTVESASEMGISWYNSRDKIDALLKENSERSKKLERDLQYTFMGIAENQDEILKLKHEIEGIS